MMTEFIDQSMGYHPHVVKCMATEFNIGIPSYKSTRSKINFVLIYSTFTKNDYSRNPL